MPTGLPGSNARAAALATTACREMAPLARLQRRARVQASVAGGVQAVARGGYNEAQDFDLFAACPRAHRQTKNATVEVMTPGGVRAYKIGNVEWRHGRPLGPEHQRLMPP